MNITLETIEAGIALIVFLSVAIERGVELFRPLFLKIADAEWQSVVKIALAMILGILVAALLRLDFLTTVGIPMFGVWAGYVAAGVLASAGSAPWHALLEWLKTLKNDTKTVTTTLNVADKETVQKVTEVSSLSTTPVEPVPPVSQ
jgi:uncharacterized protein YacL